MTNAINFLLNDLRVQIDLYRQSSKATGFTWATTLPQT